MYILAVGLNHKTAPVEVREKLSFSHDDMKEALELLKQKQHIEGCAILSTCNRTEVYAAVTDVDTGLAGIKEFLSESSGFPLSEIRDYLYVHTLYDAVRHVFRVAAGLDSMIIGETQILGQVREAYEVCRDLGGTNGVLNTLFQQAITVGKRVRTETKIDQNAVSISYAAVELAKQTFADLQGKKVLLVGAGKMSQLTAKHLVSHGVNSVLVTNRSYDRAIALAEEFGGKAVYFEQFYDYLPQVDIVVSCTAASGYVITPDGVARAMGQAERELFIIDIAVPRDVDPAVGDLPNVTLKDIDELQHVVDANLEERRRLAHEAEKIIEDEIVSFFKWLSSLFVVPTIKALREKADTIKDNELTRAFNRLAPVSDREKKVIGSLANSIVNQLLHDPIINLKEYAATHQGHLYAKILQNLFNLEVEGQQMKKKEMGQKPVGIKSSKK